MDGNKIFISAGEISGDFHAANLMNELNQLGNFQISGLGGKKMFEAGLQSFTEDVSILNTVGFLESLRFIGKKVKILNASLRYMQKENIKNCILVDNQGFNLLMAKKCKERDIRTFYYVPPRVSIWGHWNAPKVAAVSDYLIPYLETDIEIYEKYTERVFYAGNPLIDRINGYTLDEGFYDKHGLDSAKPIVSLFPGSRYQEIKKLTRIFLKAAKKIKTESEAQIIMAISHPEFEKEITPLLIREGMEDEVKLIAEDVYGVMKAAQVNIMASGTATLESTLLHRPPVICYRISPISFWVGKKLVKKKMIGLPNILLDRKEFPELLQRDCNPDKISRQCLDWLKPDKREKKRLEDLYGQIRRKIGNPPVVKKTAEFIAEKLKNG